MDVLKLEPATTALVLIDLQKGIVGMKTAPHAADQVVERSAKLLEKFRSLDAARVLVHVKFSPDGRDAPPREVDEPMNRPGMRSPDFSDFVPQIAPQAGDIAIVKHQWGAFYGTELDLQLRRRGVRTIVIGGIATNFGVESTARDAWERSYNMVFAEDAMASMAEEAHHFAVKHIFPRLGRIRSTEQILAALA